MSAIVILGVFVADTAYRAARLPVMGETVLGTAFTLGPGGKGSNQAVAAAMAGGDVTLITRIGEDAFGAIARATWDRAGVKAALQPAEGAATGAAFIFLEAATGNNAIIIAPGAAGRIGAEDIEASRSLIAGSRIFITQLEQPVAAAQAALTIARAAGVLTLLNPAPAAPLDDGFLALCDLAVPNESEAEALTGITVGDAEGAARAGRALLDRGIRQAVIVTLGHRGSCLVQRGGTTMIPPFHAGAVADTTGAGDAFCGALSVALAEGLPLQDACRFASAAASISVTRPGTAPSMPARADIEALLRA